MGFLSTIKTNLNSAKLIAKAEKRAQEARIKAMLAEAKAKRLEEEKRQREASKPKLTRSQRAIKISNDIAKGLDTAGRIASRTPIMQPPRSVKAYAQDNDDISGYLANFMPNPPRRRVQYVDDDLDYEAYLRRFMP